MGVLTDYFIAGSDAEAAGALNAVGGPEQAGLTTLQLKGVDPVVNLATLEGILTGADPMVIIGEGADPVADGGSDGPWILRVRPTLVTALRAADAGKLPDVAADWAATEEYEGTDPKDLLDVLHDLGRLANQSRDENKSLYCWMSL
jgi:hypothetical protein